MKDQDLINKAQDSKNIIIMGHFDGYGGSQTAFKMLIDFAVNEGHQIKLVFVSDFPDKVYAEYDESKVLGIIPHRTPAITSKVSKVFSLISTSRKAKVFDSSIFITVGLKNSANFIAKRLNKKTFKLGQDFIANRTIEEKIWVDSRNTLDGIALQAPAMLEYWKDTGADSSKLNWLPCFPQPPVSNVRRKNKEYVGKLKIAYFGRIAGNKGIDLLIKALSNAKVPDTISLDIWGKGEEETKLLALTECLNLTDRIRFKGRYPDGKEGAKLMASYECLTLCSTATEGLPLILLEAMAYGLPLLVTNVGAIRDCCTDNPDTVLVEPTETDIVNGLIEVNHRISNNLFDAERQAKYYEENFSYQVMAYRWRACLQNPHKFFNNAE